MDYEKKYKEALEKAQRFYNNSVAITNKGLEDIFPELKESDDERIRKAIKEAVETLSDSPLKVKMLAWLEKQGNLMKALQISNAKIGELVEKNYYLKEQLEKQGKNNMGISEATKQKLEDNLNKALEKETPESWNEFLEKQGEQKPVNTDYISGVRKELLGIEDNAKNINGLTESQWVAIRAAHRLLGEYITKEQKLAEWSEEDENMLKVAIISCEQCGNEYAYYWLKSLKDRYTWKPSDEQMRILDLAIRCGINIGTTEETTLVSLFNDLKKLRGE